MIDTEQSRLAQFARHGREYFRQPDFVLARRAGQDVHWWRALESGEVPADEHAATCVAAAFDVDLREVRAIAGLPLR